MLRHLGEDSAASDIERAVELDLANRGDSKRSTSQIGDSLLEAVK